MTTSPNTIDVRAKLLLSLSNPHRLAILYALSGHELPIGRLSQLLNIPASAVWQHLAQLRSLNVVSVYRKGYTTVYRCDSGAVGKLIRVLNDVDRSEED